MYLCNTFKSITDFVTKMFPWSVVCCCMTRITRTDLLQTMVDSWLGVHPKRIHGFMDRWCNTAQHFTTRKWLRRSDRKATAEDKQLNSYSVHYVPND